MDSLFFVVPRFPKTIVYDQLQHSFVLTVTLLSSRCWRKTDWAESPPRLSGCSSRMIWRYLDLGFKNCQATKRLAMLTKLGPQTGLGTLPSHPLDLPNISVRMSQTKICEDFGTINTYPHMLWPSKNGYDPTGGPTEPQDFAVVVHHCGPGKFHGNMRQTLGAWPRKTENKMLPIQRPSQIWAGVEPCCGCLTMFWVFF